MNASLDTHDRNQTGDPREISKWTRVYAQNRSLPVVVFMLIYVLLCVALGGSSYLAGRAYRDGQMLLFGACLAVLLLAVAAVIYMAAPWWGGKQLQRMVSRLYAKEGNVALSGPQCAKPVRVILVVGFLACVMSSVILDMLGYIPDGYVQPVSALYCVPFLVILTLLMRPAVGFLALLWPAFYGLHAILILADVPIFLTGRSRFLNIVLPMAGYGILAGLIAHAYSRIALRKLKKLAQTGLARDSEPGEVA